MRNSSGYAVVNLLRRGVTDPREYDDGPPSGYGASGNLPPRASLLGVRSLSLVLADFPALFLFLLFIFLFLSFLVLSLQSP